MSLRAAVLCCAMMAPVQALGQEPAAPREGNPVETLEQITGERIRGEADEIETDRDSFTPASTVVGRGRIVAETAYSFEDNRGIKETHSLPELIVRFGITERVEL